MEKTLILGIGNTIRGDDGIGIRVARKLKQILPPQYTIKELSSAGLDLMEAIAGFKKAILIDAVQTTGGVPGHVYHLSPQEFQYSSSVLSFHALDLNQVIEIGKKLMEGKMPRIEVLAVETPRLNEFSENLSPALEDQFDKIVEIIKNKVEKAG